MVTVWPAYGVTVLIPALRGWPRAVAGGVGLVVVVVLYTDVIICYRRRRRAARRDMYARIGTALASYEATKRTGQN